MAAKKKEATQPKELITLTSDFNNLNENQKIALCNYLIEWVDLKLDRKTTLPDNLPDCVVVWPSFYDATYEQKVSVWNTIRAFAINTRDSLM